MKALKKNLTAMWNDESAQGMVEYILILVAVIGFVFLVRGRLQGSLEKGLGKVDDGVGAFEGRFNE
jgi:Flp pilus assembly pilin Flp